MNTLPPIGAYLRPTADTEFTQFALQVVRAFPHDGSACAIEAHSMPLGEGRRPLTSQPHPGLSSIRLQAQPDGTWLDLGEPDYLHRAWELAPADAPAPSQHQAIVQFDLFAA